MSDPVANWWKAFQEAAPRIAGRFEGKGEFDVADWMHKNLGAFHPDLMWEFGPALKQPGHRLVITPEARHELRPLVWLLLSRAPEIPGWEFYEFRLPEEFERASAAVRGRTGGELTGVTFAAQRGNHHRLDVRFHCSAPDLEQDLADEITFVGIEVLVGEEYLNRWIGVIEASLEPPQGPVFELTDLAGHVDRFIADIQAELPAEPWHAVAKDAMRYSLLTLEPEEAEDYSHQNDLAIVGVAYLPMIQNALSGVSFDSKRFSKFGERFCYLKIDGSAGLEHSEFADRAEIEDAVNEAIRPDQLGSVIGGGTGRRYSYIELALTNIDAAWEQISTVLSAGRIPKRTWLFSHDADWAELCYGVYDDTPAPP